MIEIKITGATPLEALASVTAFGIRCLANEDVSAAANRILEAEAHKEAKEAKATKDTVKPKDEPAAETWEPGGGTAVEETEYPPAEESPFPEPEPTPKEKAKAKKYTLAEIREAGTSAARAHGTPAVKAILTALGVNGMGDLKEDQYADFMDRLKGLGESNA